MRQRRFRALALESAGAAVFSCVLLAAAPTLRERLGGFFSGWYSSVPGTHVEAVETREISVPGFSAWRITRRPDAVADKDGPQESSLALYDAGKDRAFLGEILQDPDRVTAKKPFEKGSDLPNMRASLQEFFGQPVGIELGGDRPVAGLLPLKVVIQQAPEAFASRPGYVSTDGATVLLGEFRPVSESLAAWREKLLAERPGVRVENGRYVVTEFLDFQCERCKQRTPESRRAVRERGGTLEIRFFPLVKQHDWSFAAAECAAALAAQGVSAYARFEEAIFARQDGMTAAAARELAGDIADSAGARAAFDAEIASGRARDRVVRDIDLGVRIGAHGTPLFVLDGQLIAGQRGSLENALLLSRMKSSAGVQPSGGPARGGR